MPIYKVTVAGATQFTGLTAIDGLLDFKAHLPLSNQILLNSVRYRSDGDAHEFSILSADPSDAANVVVMFNNVDDLGNDLYYVVKELLPTTTTSTGIGDPHSIRFATTGKTDAGILTIDYDLVRTPGA